MFIASKREKIPTGRVALGDGLRCYKVTNRVEILPNMESELATGRRLMVVVAVGSVSSRDVCPVTLVQDSTQRA